MNRMAIMMTPPSNCANTSNSFSEKIPQDEILGDFIYVTWQ